MSQSPVESLIQSIVKLSREDPRFEVEAYLFILDALEFAHREMKLGGVAHPGESTRGKGHGAKPSAKPTAKAASTPETASEDSAAGETDRHLTGQQLCEACRQFAWRQFGYMAETVLAHWGLRSTGDFGEIVYNMIRVDRMRKTEDDRREDFDGVYDFARGLTGEFRIQVPPPVGDSRESAIT